MLRVRRSPRGCRVAEHKSATRSTALELQLSADGASDEHFSASAMQIRACGVVNGSEWDDKRGQ